MLTKNASSFLAQAFVLKTLGKGTNEQRCPFCLAFGIKEQRLLRDNTHPKVRRHGFAARNACSLTCVFNNFLHLTEVSLKGSVKPGKSSVIRLFDSLEVVFLKCSTRGCVKNRMSYHLWLSSQTGKRI